MLKQRVITGLVLGGFMIWAILSFSTLQLSLLLAGFTVVGAWEWSRLIGLTSVVSRGVYSAVVAIAIAILHSYYEQLSQVHLVLLIVSCLWWLIGSAWVFNYKGQKGLTSANTRVGLIVGFVLLLPTWSALTQIHGFTEQGPYLLLLVMVLIAAADSGAYFTGRALGKRKLAPMVSPGKTIEGVIGGLVLALLIAVIAGSLFDLAHLGVVSLVLIALVVVPFSVMGDLLESLFKRRVGIKDSGIIFPGHGGVLDRIDSLTAAAPIFALGLIITEALA